MLDADLAPQTSNQSAEMALEVPTLIPTPAGAEIEPALLMPPEKFLPPMTRMPAPPTRISSTWRSWRAAARGASA